MMCKKRSQISKELGKEIEKENKRFLNVSLEILKYLQVSVHVMKRSLKIFTRKQYITFRFPYNRKLNNRRTEK